MDEIEIIAYRGFNIMLFQDETPESPREWDNMGTMICKHPRYDLGDKHNLSAEEILEIVNRKDVLSLPLVLLDHSGLWMKVGSSWNEDPGGWDTSKVGFIYVTYETLRKEYSVKRITKNTLRRAESSLRSEVNMYSDYLEGSVYGYGVMDTDREVVNSCWGFYGTDGYSEAVREGETFIDGIVNAELYQKRLGDQLPMFEEVKVC